MRESVRPMKCVQCLEQPMPGLRAAGTAVALGYFDGVHVGHRAVLDAAVRAAEENGLTAAAFTFTLPHGGAGKGKAILTPREKLRRMETCGIEAVLCPAFEEFCALSPEQFVDQVLVRVLRAKRVFTGDDFTFGTHKSGNVEVLRRLCGQRGIGTEIVPTQMMDGAAVSSTRIRECLEAGEVGEVNALLGEPYAVTLPVQHGRGLGRTLGFPTINQTFPEGMIVPKLGVYITETCLNGRWMPSATGLGTRPTVSSEGTVTCETFIPDFEGDVYGEQMAVRFLKYLWPSRRFDTLEELTGMVRQAAQLAREYFQECGPV